MELFCGAQDQRPWTPSGQKEKPYGSSRAFLRSTYLHCALQPNPPVLSREPLARERRRREFLSRRRVSTIDEATPGSSERLSVRLEEEPERVVFPRSYYDAHGRLMLKCLTLSELERWCESIEEHPKKRARQLWRWMYYDKLWLRDIDEAPAQKVQNGFSASFRDKIRNIATIDGGLEPIDMRRASDGTRKVVFKLTAGPSAGGQIETVLIPIVRESGSKTRITVCVSSQVGCAMACHFCLTGKMGLLGNLTPGQIVEQVVFARRLLFEEDADVKQNKNRYITNLTNIVFMGMGEPLDNMSGVLPALEILQQPLGLHFAASKITVSTVGLVPEMRRLRDSTNVVMAVSLHASIDGVRSSIVPVNRRYPLPVLVAAMEELFPVRKDAEGFGQHVLIEYTMLSGINDSPADAEILVKLLKNVRCKINLIVFNPHEGTKFRPSTPEAVAAFRGVLIREGHVATVRASRGDDEMAACGQLGNPDHKRTKKKTTNNEGFVV